MKLNLATLLMSTLFINQNCQKLKNKEALLKTTQFPHRFGDVKEYAQLSEHIINNTDLNGETMRLD